MNLYISNNSIFSTLFTIYSLAFASFVGLLTCLGGSLASYRHIVMRKLIGLVNFANCMLDL